MNNTDKKLPSYERELMIAHILKKSREYVLSHPEIRLNKAQNLKLEKMINRRLAHEPLAYIFGHKEFYGLDFKVNQHTLIPRPETELIVEYLTNQILNTKQIPNTIIDVGTGSGNIIVTLAKINEQRSRNKIKYFATDISSEALKVAKINAQKHDLDKKIKFLQGNILSPFIQNSKFKIQNSIIVANLPYLSEKIYEATEPNVKNFEPQSALLSGQDGLDHYRELLDQLNYLLKNCYVEHAMCFMEISPEQKNKLEKIIRKIFPEAKINFHKDLAGKWRICEMEIRTTD